MEFVTVGFFPSSDYTAVRGRPPLVVASRTIRRACARIKMRLPAGRDSSGGATISARARDGRDRRGLSDAARPEPSRPPGGRHFDSSTCRLMVRLRSPQEADGRGPSRVVRSWKKSNITTPADFSQMAVGLLLRLYRATKRAIRKDRGARSHHASARETLLVAKEMAEERLRSAARAGGFTVRAGSGSDAHEYEALTGIPRQAMPAWRSGDLSLRCVSASRQFEDVPGPIVFRRCGRRALKVRAQLRRHDTRR